MKKIPKNKTLESLMDMVKDVINMSASKLIMEAYPYVISELDHIQKKDILYFIKKGPEYKNAAKLAAPQQSKLIQPLIKIINDNKTIFRPLDIQYIWNLINRIAIACSDYSFNLQKK